MPTSVARIKAVVFLALVLDLLAFTIPLPLFPRIIEWYTQREASDQATVLSRTLWGVRYVRDALYKDPKAGRRTQWDIVLLGGVLGSLFSALQFAVSPYIGSLSDRYGRKPVLLTSMIGNILSGAVWLKSTSFSSFLVARAIGGFSEGNVQVSIAILSDITDASTRARSLAIVGLAFALCFSTGPILGAYFASHPFPPTFGPFANMELNVYATPAALTIVLLVIETLFLAVFLPETRGFVLQPAPGSTPSEKPAEIEVEEDTGFVHAPPPSSASTTVAPASTRLRLLSTLRLTHFLFLSIFSGIEFTLTFLTYDLFDWSNAQNGKLLGTIGVLSALLQGGYVRRSIRKVGEGRMALYGVQACTLGFAVLAVLPLAGGASGPRLIYAGAACLAFTSATVVNALTALASLQCDEPVDSLRKGTQTEVDPRLLKGRALGEFRSAGQLGRALGPLLACASYWTIGPSLTYGISAALMVLLTLQMRGIAVKPKTD